MLQTIILAIFFFLDKKYSCFQVSTEFSFQDGEYVFNELTSAIFLTIEQVSHFLSVFPTDNLIVPGTGSGCRFCLKIFPNKTMYLRSFDRQYSLFWIRISPENTTIPEISGSAHNNAITLRRPRRDAPAAVQCLQAYL